MNFLLRLIQFFTKLLYLIVYPILNFILPKKKDENVPGIKNKLLTMSLVDLVKEMRARRLKSKDLVQSYIERIEETNSILNAVVEQRFTEALHDAERADGLIAKCSNIQAVQKLFSHYPLLGIPFTVKESCGLKGMSHVVGSCQRSGKKSKEDGKSIENLKAAGAIPLLVSANPEYCFSIETNTHTDGKCLNPYDFRRTCGGSSGGEAALNGCGASLFGIGSDIAGSIRIPCLFNGIFGHKPTGGLLSNEGHFPNSIDSDCLEYLQYGPMSRFAADLGLILQVMAGNNAQKLDLFRPIDTKSIKIYYSLGFHGLNGLLHQSVDFGIELAIMKAVKCFEIKGVATERAKFKYFHNSTEMALSAIAGLDGFNYLIDSESESGAKNTFKELIKSVFGNSNYTKEALIFELMRRTNAFMSKHNVMMYKKELVFLKEEIIDILGSDGVLFFPTFHVPAIHHHSSCLPLWGIDYTLLFNALGLPCTHVPMGLHNDLPTGFQVIAAPMNDRLCLQMASEIENFFGGWVPPSKHEF